MARANDLGSENPGDAGDVAPANPATGRAPLDYAIPQPFRTSRYEISEVSKDAESPLEIDIQSTVINDSINGLQSILSDLLAIDAESEADARLGLSILGWVIGTVLDSEGVGTTRVARSEFNYDEGNERWRAVSMFQCIVKSESADTLICHTYNDGVEGTVDITVAKPHELRQTPYDGQTIEGVTYSYQSANSRTATSTIDGESVTFTEEIVRKYTADFTKIMVAPVASGSGITTTDLLIDKNLGARAWAKTGEL